MMQLRVTPPNGGKPVTFWAPLSYKLGDLELYSYGGGTVEILRVAK